MDYDNVALTIAGSDSGGGAGLQADLKTFAAFGVHGVSIVTSLTAQNTQGVGAIHDPPIDFIRAQFKAIHDDFPVKAAKSGMLSNKEIIEAVAGEISDYKLVVDPVMVAQSGAKLLQDDAVESLQKLLLPKALVATPNIPEAEVLTGRRIGNEEEMKEACADISKLGCSVVLKGGHLNAVDILYHEGNYHVYTGELRPFEVHGAGCTFASAITAELAKGKDLPMAVEGAKEFISKAIEMSYEPGKGARVANQVGSIRNEADRHRVIESLKKATSYFQQNEKAHLVIPQVGTNIAYALENASSIEEVAGKEGRMIKAGYRVGGMGAVKFGGSKHVASVILAVMERDPWSRAAMNIKHSEELVGICEELFDCASFDRKDEPAGMSTMEWGTSHAIKEHGKVPDAIHDLGSEDKEAMIRILGRTPEEVLKKLDRILEQI